jgi:hypothetical protein
VAHHDIVDIIQSCMRKPQNNWTLIHGEDAFVTEAWKRVRGPKRQHRPLEVLALVTKVQKAQDPSVIMAKKRHPK